MSNKLTKAQEKRFEKFWREASSNYFDLGTNDETDYSKWAKRDVKQHLADELARQKKEIIEEIIQNYDDEIKKAEKDDFRTLAKFLIDMRGFAIKTINVKKT